MRGSDTLVAMWREKLRMIRMLGYDPYNSAGDLRVGRISLSWRP